MSKHDHGVRTPKPPLVTSNRSQVRSVLWLSTCAQRVNQVMTGLMGTAIIIYFIILYFSLFLWQKNYSCYCPDLTCDLHFNPATKPLLPFK